LAIEKHKSNDLKKYPVANEPIIFADGTLLQADGKIYVMENNKKRRIQDLTALLAMGYKKENLISIDLITALGIPNGESFYIENNLDKKPNGVVMTEDNESMEIVQPSPLVQPVSDVEYTYDQNDVKDLFKTEVPAYLVVEYPSGKILAGKDVDTKRPLASLTKLVTAYVAIKQGYNFRETTTYYESRHSNYGNPLKLATGEQMKNDDLFNSLLILSMNKASRMIAQQKMTEDAFIKKMNEQIKIWGLKNTIFEDTSGLSENNLASARNLSKIFYEGLQIPEINAALSTKEYSLTKLSCITEKCTYTFPNTDHLMAETNPTFTVLAGKTGYTDEAQSVLVQRIQDNESNKQIIIVSVGNLDYAHRFDEPRRLSEWVVKNY
jgi:D-alanyl-D-alanine carboxypeptidase